MTRPYLTVRAYVWRDRDGSQTPGFALMHGRDLKAHLTHAEARTLADQLHDLADALESYGGDQ